MFFVNYFILFIVTFEYMQLLILINVFALFFFIFLDIFSTLTSYIIISKLTLYKFAFDNIFFVQKLFFFNILLFSFILIQNITRSSCFLIAIIFLRTKSVALIFVSHIRLIILFVVVIIIFLIFFFFLI